MRNHKRFIALLLVAVMAISGTIMNVVSAAKLTDAEDITGKGALTGTTLVDAIDILHQLGVVAGVSNVVDEDGKVTEYTFDGDSDVTRQQFALFTARIETAHPEYFAFDPTVDVQNSSNFQDLVDPTYTLAINHCFDEGYIVGRDDDGLVFAPTDNVTFAEAVTMLMRALGYTGLTYPAGFMTKAADREVALIGEWADFPMVNVEYNKPITRSQMAMLLWNFLLGQRFELEMVYNGAKDQWDAWRIGHGILNAFGIKRTVGYVTAVPNWEANIEIEYIGGRYTLMGSGLQAGLQSGLQASTSQFQAYNDICISSIVYNYSYTYSDPDTSRAVVSAYDVPMSTYNLVTTMKKLGLSKYEDDPLYLLGLKVTAFEDKRVNPAFNINIPTIVNGVKTEIDIEDVIGTYNTANSGIVDTLSIPFPVEELEVDRIDRVDFIDARIANLYMFGDYGTGLDFDINTNALDARLRGVRGGLTEPKTVQLTQMVQKGTKNYRLELVYNGTLIDGTPEYFYIFRPFKAGVYAKDPDRDRLVMTTEVVNAVATDKQVVNPAIYREYQRDDDTDEISYPEIASTKFYEAYNAKFPEKKITDFTLEKAYLYTYYGPNLDVYAVLDDDDLAVPISANYNANLVTFKLKAEVGLGFVAGAGVNKDIYFNHGYPQALGAWNNANRVDIPSTAIVPPISLDLNDPKNKAQYTAYYDYNADYYVNKIDIGERYLLARRTNDGPNAYYESQYVVILSLSATREVTLRDPATQVRIGQAYKAVVLEAATGRVSEMVIHLVNGRADDYAFGEISWTGIDNDAVLGMPVRLVKRGFDYYDVSTKFDKDFISNIEGKEYAGYKLSSTGADMQTAFSTDINGNRTSLPKQWTKPADPTSVFSYINANTGIIIYSDYDNTAARYVGNTTGLAYLKEILALSTDTTTPYTAYDLIAVGLGSNINTGAARFVYVRTDSPIKAPPVAVDNYAIVMTVNTGLSLGGYTYGTARLADGTDVLVASLNADVVRRGNLVYLTGNKTAAYGDEYNIVTRLDNILDVTDPSHIDRFFPVNVGTPTNLPDIVNYGVDGENLWAKGYTLWNYYSGFGFDLAGGPTFGDPYTPFFEFTQNSFKTIVAYTPYDIDTTVDPVVATAKAPVLVTEGRPRHDNADIKEQFLSISQNEYQKIVDAGGKIYMITYTAGIQKKTGGRGTDEEKVVFATMIIDLRGITEDSTKAAGWNYGTFPYNNPYGWRDLP